MEIFLMVLMVTVAQAKDLADAKSQSLPYPPLLEEQQGNDEYFRSFSSESPSAIGSEYSFSLGTDGTIKSPSIAHKTIPSMPSDNLPVSGSGYTINIGSQNEAHTKTASLFESHELRAAPTVSLGESSGVPPVIGSGYSFSLGTNANLKSSSIAHEPISSIHSENLPVIGSGYTKNIGSQNEAHTKTASLFEKHEIPAAPTVSLEESSGVPPVIGSGYSFSLGTNGNLKSSSIAHKPISSIASENLPVIGSGYTINIGSQNEAHTKTASLFESHELRAAPTVSLGESSGVPPVIGSGYSFSLGTNANLKSSSIAHEPISSIHSENLPVIGSGYTINIGSQNEAHTKTASLFENHEIPAAPTVSLEESSGVPPVIGSGYSFTLGTNANLKSSSIAHKPISSIHSENLPVIGSGYTINIGSQNESHLKSASSFESHKLPTTPTISFEKSSGSPPVIGSGYSFSLGTNGNLKSPSIAHKPISSIPSENLPVIGSGYTINIGSKNEAHSKTASLFESHELREAPTVSFAESSGAPPIIGSGYSFNVGTDVDIKTSSIAHKTIPSIISKDLPIVGSGYTINIGSQNEAHSKSAALIESHELPAAPTLLVGESSGLPPVIGSGYSFSLGTNANLKSSSIAHKPISSIHSENLPVVGSGYTINIGSQNEAHLKAASLFKQHELPAAPTVLFGEPSRVPQVIGSGYGFRLGSNGNIRTLSFGQKTNPSISPENLPVIGSGYTINVGSQNQAHSKSASLIESHGLSAAPTLSFAESSGALPVIGSGYSFNVGTDVDIKTSSIAHKTIPSIISKDLPIVGSGYTINIGSQNEAHSKSAELIESHELPAAPTMSFGGSSRVPPVIDSGFKINLSSGDDSQISRTEKKSNAFLPSSEAIDFSQTPIVVADGPYP